MPGESLLLKQGLAADSAESLDNEAALYRRLAAAGGDLAAAVPRLHGYDEPRGLLILEWIADGEDLYRHHAGRPRCSVRAGARRSAACSPPLHAVAPDDEELRCDAPWVLSLHRPRAGGAALPQRRRASSSSRRSSATRDFAAGAGRAARRLARRGARPPRREVGQLHRPPARRDRARRLGDGRLGRSRARRRLGVRRVPRLAAALRDSAAMLPPSRRSPRSGARTPRAGPARRGRRRAAASARCATPGARLVQSAYEKTQETGMASERGARGLRARARAAAVAARGRRRAARDRAVSGRYEAQVVAALGAVGVRPPERVPLVRPALRGARPASRSPSAIAQPAAAPTSTAPGAPRPARPGRAAGPADAAASSRGALSQANCGRGSWQAGWRVAAIEEDAIAVVRAGRARAARAARGLPRRGRRSPTCGCRRTSRRRPRRAARCSATAAPPPDDESARAAELEHHRRRRRDARRAADVRAQPGRPAVHAGAARRPRAPTRAGPAPTCCSRARTSRALRSTL